MECEQTEKEPPGGGGNRGFPETWCRPKAATIHIQDFGSTLYQYTSRSRPKFGVSYYSRRKRLYHEGT